jgi:N-acetyl-alpha-D-muramate 1-phosphate uridylyltransferase
MKAMILAAGRGERMRPLTDQCPKPLLPVAGVPLIVWHLRGLARAGFVNVVINHAHLGAMIESSLGDGSGFGLRIRYSAEQEALETAGGIAKALPLLGDAPFLLINGDIFCDWSFARAHSIAQQMAAGALQAWCVLVANPPQNPNGDFALAAGQLLNEAPSIQPSAQPSAQQRSLPMPSAGRVTYAGIGVFLPQLFADITAGSKAPLAPLLRSAASQGRAGAEWFDGQWIDVGTPQRLAELDRYLTGNRPPNPDPNHRE